MHRQLAVVSGPWSGFLYRSRNLAALVCFAGFAASRLAFADLSPASAGEAAGAKTGNPLWGIPLSDLRTTIERPLFSHSRRPPPRPLAPTPVVAVPSPPPRPVEPSRPPLALLGTIVGERTEIAVFLEETTNDIVHLKVGQDRAGWTLRAVHGRQVDFERGHRIATLSFKRDAEDQRPATPTVDAAASSNPDMVSYRAAVNRMRGR
jgi:hypothetical protein